MNEIENKNMTASPSEDRIPVIVGVGEIVDRPKEITAGRAASVWRNTSASSVCGM